MLAFSAPRPQGRGAFFVLYPSKLQCKVCIVKEIREWLESGQDYAQGVALYESHGSSQVVLTTLGYGATEFNRQKLRKELLNIAEAVTAPVVPVRAPKAPKEAQLVAVDEALHEQRRAWFAERNHLHPQLELVSTDAERLAMSLRILELGDLISESYAAPLVVPAPPSLAHLADQGEMRRLLANLRPQRTKLKKRPDRATDLAQVESEIKFLEEKLKRDGGKPKLH